jgi:hypothetical protein
MSMPATSLNFRRRAPAHFMAVARPVLHAWNSAVSVPSAIWATARTLTLLTWQRPECQEASRRVRPEMEEDSEYR